MRESRGDFIPPATALAARIKVIIPVCNQISSRSVTKTAFRTNTFRTNISSSAQSGATDPAPVPTKGSHTDPTKGSHTDYANPFVSFPPPRLAHGKRGPRAHSHGAWHHRHMPSRKSGSGR